MSNALTSLELEFNSGFLHQSHDGRGGVKVTTIRGVHHDNDIELDLAGANSIISRPGVPQAFEPRVLDIKENPDRGLGISKTASEERRIDDGLSLHSDSITDGEFDEDDRSNRRGHDSQRAGSNARDDRKVGWEGML